MSDDKHPFFLLSNDDREGWRGGAVTAAFLDLLVQNVEMGRRAIQIKTRERKTDEAFILAGKLEALEEILSIATHREQQLETQDEPFSDPAAI